MQNVSAQSDRCSSTSMRRDEPHVGPLMGSLRVPQDAVEMNQKRTGFSGIGTITVENGYIISVTNKTLARLGEHATDRPAGLSHPTQLLRLRGVL